MDKDSFNHHTKITAPELATLWSQYMNDSLSHCILRYFVHHVKDEDIKDVLIYALDLSERHLQKVKEFLTEEKYPIPIGFRLSTKSTAVFYHYYPINIWGSILIHTPKYAVKKDKKPLFL